MSSMQQFKSIEYSVRTQDALAFYGILSQIYSEIYTKYYGHLHFFKNANEETLFKDSIIQSIETKNAQQKLKNIQEKILEIYVDNSAFFEKKYFVKKSEISALSNNKDKGNYILRKVIDNFDFSSFSTVQSFLKEVVFKDVYPCEVIVQNNFIPSTKNSIKYIDGSIKSDFFKTAFSTIENKFYRISSLPQNFYYLDGGLTKFTKPPFYFEYFLSYDFDRTNFVFDDQFMIDPQGDISAFESFLFSCLNTSFFLSTKTNPVTKNIIVNPYHFQKIFPKKITDNDASVQKSYETRLNIIKNKMRNFISNVRLGMRLVYCNDFIETATKNQPIINNLKKPKTFSSVDEYSIMKQDDLLSSYLGAYGGTDEWRINTKETFFSELEKNIIKDKSHVLYYKDGNQSKVRRAVPIVYVYDEPLPVEKINNDDIFDYISSTINENSSVINSLKDKMMMTEEFKII
mgnify:CR=1 FL=1